MSAQFSNATVSTRYLQYQVHKAGKQAAGEYATATWPVEQVHVDCELALLEPSLERTILSDVSIVPMSYMELGIAVGTSPPDLER